MAQHVRLQSAGLLRWTEHDPTEIWDSVVACIEGAMAAAGDVEVLD